MAAINLVDTKAAYDYQRMHDEGEEKIAYQHKHSSLDIPRKVKDLRLRQWLKEEGLLFLTKDLYCLKFTDLASITDDEVEALSINLDTSQKIRFRNAIKNLRINIETRFSLKDKTKSTTSKPTKYDDVFKLILIGDCFVGKTSILNRFVNDIFEPLYETTIGLNFEDQIITMPQKNVKLQIYDTNGSHLTDQFGTVSRAFFRDAHGALIIYDITNQQSFENVTNWIEKLGICADEKAWKMLIGNKCDLENQRVIDKNDGQQIANQYGLKFMECSAKRGDRVDAIFSIASQYLLAVWDKPEQGSNKSNKCCCVVL